MKKKLLVFAIAFVMVVVLLTGCGGAKQGRNSIKPTTAHLTVIATDDSGQAVENADITIGDEKKVTNDKGHTVFDTLQPGDYTISAEKDGYELAEEKVSLKAGDQKTVNLTLNKKTETEKINDISKLKSYKAAIEMKSDEGESGKILIVQDDFGKEQHITVYDKDGKVQFDLYIANGKAKIKSEGGEWMDVPESTVGMMTKSTVGFAESMTNNTIEDFNGTITGKDLRYSVKKIGRETVNGYPTDKYHLYAKGGSDKGKGVLQGDLWIINHGEYKGYTTRMLITATDNEGKGTFTTNLTDLGKNMHISLP